MRTSLKSIAVAIVPSTVGTSVRCSWLTMAMFFCASTQFAWGQVDPVENYLQSAEQKATNVVNGAGAQGRGVAMEAGQSALNAIASFRAAYADSLKLSSTALSGQQADLFRKIHSTIDSLDSLQKMSANNLQDVANTLSAAIAQIPLSKDFPRVTKIGPLYQVEGSGPDQEVVVRGIGLSNGRPVLEVHGKSIYPNTGTDTELRFPVPAHSAVGNRPLVIAGTLRLFERKTSYFVLNDYLPRTYPVRLAIYPQQIGTFTLTPRLRVASLETKPQSTPGYRCQSPQGSGSNTVPVSVVPTSGWTIDPSSIQYHSSYSNHGSYTTNTTSPAGFTATLSCSGWGRATGPFGVVIDAGQIGVEQGTFTYTEVRSGTSLKNGTPRKPQSLQWGGSITISELPAETETVIVDLMPFTGQSLSVEGDGNIPFLRLTFNASSKVATVTAKGIEESLRR